MSFWSPDKECDRPLTSEYYELQAEKSNLEDEVERLKAILRENGLGDKI